MDKGPIADPGVRLVIAFTAAPLVVPGALLVATVFEPPGASGAALVAVIAAGLLSYLGAIFLGIPAYCFLARRSLNSVSIAVPTGFIVGAIMWLVFLVLLPASLGQGLQGIRFALTDSVSLRGALWPAGVLGAAAGMAFWLIARPDLRTPRRPLA
jgi:hypothetical protein